MFMHIKGQKIPFELAEFACGVQIQFSFIRDIGYCMLLYAA